MVSSHYEQSCLSETLLTLFKSSVDFRILSITRSSTASSPLTEIITAVCFEPWTFSCTGPSAQKPCLISPFYLTLVLHPFRLWLRHPILQEVYLPLSPARWDETCSSVLMRPPIVPLAQHLPRSAIILSLSASCSRLELGVRGRQTLSLIWVGIHSTSDRAWHSTGTH